MFRPLVLLLRLKSSADLSRPDSVHRRGGPAIPPMETSSRTLCVCFDLFQTYTMQSRNVIVFAGFKRTPSGVFTSRCPPNLVGLLWMPLQKQQQTDASVSAYWVFFQTCFSQKVNPLLRRTKLNVKAGPRRFQKGPGSKVTKALPLDCSEVPRDKELQVCV